MGIRFACPNGHKLNVKSVLAGRRALCPECGVKLVVPAAAGAKVVESPASSSELPVALPSGIGHPSRVGAREFATRVVQEAPAPAYAPTAPSASPPASVWYVRPKSGGQYGPATDEVFRTWIEQGRVPADAQIWRDGWSEWKLACDAADMLPAPPQALAAESGSAEAWPVYSAKLGDSGEPPQIANPDPAVVPDIGEAAVRPSSRYLAERQRANKRQMTIAVLMLVAIAVLSGILLWVLFWGGSSAGVDTQAATQRTPIPLARSLAATYVAGLYCGNSHPDGSSAT